MQHRIAIILYTRKQFSSTTINQEKKKSGRPQNNSLDLWNSNYSKERCLFENTPSMTFMDCKS